MGLGIFIALFKTAIRAISNILDAYLVGSVFNKLSTTVFYNGISNIISIPVVLMIALPEPISFEIFIYILFMAAVEVCYQFPYYKALKSIDTSIVTGMFSLGKITVPVMAYFMIGEKLGFIQYIGFFIVVFSNLILNLDFSKKTSKKFVINQAFFMMLLVSIILSFESVLAKKILLNFHWTTFYFWFASLTSFLTFLIYLFPKERIDIKKNFPVYKSKWKLFLFIESLNQIGSIGSRIALSLLPVVVMKALTSTQAIFTLLFAVILSKIYPGKFKESVSKKDIAKKLICFIFIIIGVIMSIMK